MATTLAQKGCSRSALGSFNYLVASSPRSLYRTGKAGTHRGVSGDDSEWFGVEYAPTKVEVLNARPLQKNLVRHGFEVRDTEFSEGLDFLDGQAVVQQYYPVCCELVKEVTAASQVVAFDHNVRSAGVDKSQTLKGAGAATVQGPARVVHAD